MPEVNHYPRIVQEPGPDQPVCLKIWDGEKDLCFPVSKAQAKSMALALLGFVLEED